MILYSNGCPKCNILKGKMEEKKIDFTVVDDQTILDEKGFRSMPNLEVDGQVMNFNEAINYIRRF
jgi:glutaredoxin